MALQEIFIIILIALAVGGICIAMLLRKQSQEERTAEPETPAETRTEAVSRPETSGNRPAEIPPEAPPPVPDYPVIYEYRTGVRVYKCMTCDGENTPGTAYCRICGSKMGR